MILVITRGKEIISIKPIDCDNCLAEIKILEFLINEVNLTNFMKVEQNSQYWRRSSKALYFSETKNYGVLILIKI